MFLISIACFRPVYVFVVEVGTIEIVVMSVNSMSCHVNSLVIDDKILVLPGFVIDGPSSYELFLYKNQQV